MSNNPALNGIEAILTGDEPIPSKVSNRLVIMGIRQNYQANLEVKEELEKIAKDIKNLHECIYAIDDRADRLENRAVIYDNQFKEFNRELQRLEKVSGRWDKILAIFTVVGTAIGSAFGK